MRVVLVGVALVVAAVAAGSSGDAGSRGVSAHGGRAVGACTSYLGPGGSVDRFVALLEPGDVGCLRAGIYRGNVTFRRGGRRDAPVTLAGAPGASPLLIGRIVVAADDVTIAHLRLDGRNARRLPSPTIVGDRVRLVANDVTNRHTGICVVLGSTVDRIVVRDVVIARNRIHHCGRLPRTNHDHGVYVERSRRARIVDNLIHDNADRGVQLYPDAQQTLVARNVIDGNGEGVIFSGDHGLASSGNRVVDNVIANSRRRYNVQAWWPRRNPVGRGNVAARNCLWNGAQGDVAAEVGFAARDNAVADPRYVDRIRFRPRGEPCARKAPASGAQPPPLR